MSTENTPVETEVSDDLDNFSATFFGQNTDTPEPASSEKEDTEDGPDVDALEPTDTHEDDSLEPDDEPEEEEPAPKPKSRTQERIDELTGKYREEQRERLALEARLNDVLARLDQNEPQPAPAVKTSTAPEPNDLNEDGTEKYPLGEYDAQYIKDLTRHTLKEEREAMRIQDAEEDTQRDLSNQQAALAASWTEKLGPAQERYPDFQEKGNELVSTFTGIDQAYGEYLSATLMSMEFGPDVLYHLANNLDEATKIVNMGPTNAAIALGRIESKFAIAEAEKVVAKPRVSSAPTPPPRNKGSAAATTEIPDDTEDLDLFTAKFFKSKRGG